uniref:Uncharacterized protein n=1 Tax=Avena sativa TaxID=4498 RepID=A0ACD5TLZ3_AVESA
MDKPSSQEHSIGNESDASNRVVKSKFVAMQLQLLPADVLRDILSRLSLKEVVRMSILSREWRRLRLCHPDLVFTKETFGINTTMNTDKAAMTFQELMKFNAKNLDLLTMKFINNVDSVLCPLWYASNTTTSTLDKFIVKSGLRRKHKYYIDRWDSFCTTARAKHVAFDFTSDITCFGSGFDKYKYVFPLCDLSGPNGCSINSLDLGYLCLNLPLSFCGITNLKKLTLNMVSIDGGDLQRLLLSCALLESLSMESCSSSSLRVPQELSRLNYLRVRYCDLEMLELDAPNLTKFEFDDSVVQTVLSESSKLSEVIFVSNLRLANGYDDVLDYIITQLPAALPNVQTLLLLLTACQVCSRNNCLISLLNFIDFPSRSISN